MRVLLVYDIGDDRARAKIADACQDYGLDRVQFSAFAGDLARTHQEELMLKVGKLLGKRPGKVYLVPICAKDWQDRIVIEREGDADGSA
ncbi:MAG: CRISPR-associated endonuclease Cas2 [Anaerolineae bacterium]